MILIFTKSTFFKYYVLILLLFLIAIFKSYADKKTYRVFFKDKGDSIFTPGSKLYKATLKLHTKRCIERRLKVLSPDAIITISDAPVNEEYVSFVRVSAKADIKLRLRWHNYIVAEFDSIYLKKISGYPYVKFVQPASSKFYKESRDIDIQRAQINILNYENCGKFDYGNSFSQLNLLNIPKLHQLGITGDSVLIGFLDSGFDWRRHSALKNSNIIEEFDFVNNDSLTSDDSLDVPGQQGHGTLTYSTCAGMLQGKLIGVCPKASFILAKTEDLKSETHIEEDNYAAAIEWMEALGADISSSSLGYFNFDSTDESYNYSELDGYSTIVSQAIDEASKRGMLCITAAGNGGPNPMTIISPGDADSALTVGGVTIDSTGAVTAWGGSSRGPLFDGKRKPDVAALSTKVFGAGTLDSLQIVSASGTSLSAPLIAGSVALILSAFPEIKPWQIKSLLYNFATQSQNPDNVLGYGIPDIYDAITNAGIVISSVITFPFRSYQRIESYVLSKNNIDNVTLNMRFERSTRISKFNMYRVPGTDVFAADVPIEQFKNYEATGFIAVNQGFDSYDRRMPYDSTEFFIIKPCETNIPCGVNTDDLPPIIAGDVSNSYVYPSVSGIDTRNINLSILKNSDSRIVYQIYDVMGKTLATKHIENRAAGLVVDEIDISYYASGVYFIRVEYDDMTEIVNFIITR